MAWDWWDKVFDSEISNNLNPLDWDAYQNFDKNVGGFVNDVVGGVTGKSQADASKAGAKDMAGALSRGQDIQSQQYQQNRQDMMPWMQAGQQGLGQLQAGMQSGAFDYQPQQYQGFGSQYQAPPQQIQGQGMMNRATGQPQPQGPMRQPAFQQGGQGYNPSFGSNLQGPPTGMPERQGKAMGGGAMPPQGGNKMIGEDWMALNQGGGPPMGDPSQTGVAEEFNFEADPGYQFRQKEAMDQLLRGMSARGGALSGGNLKALQDRASDLASQEYGDAFNRYGKERIMDRGDFQSDRNFGYGQFQDYQSGLKNQADTRYNRLADMANMGQRTAQGMGSMGTNYANTSAGNLAGMANARSAGRMGSANAYGQGGQNLANLAMMFM